MKIYRLIISVVCLTFLLASSACSEMRVDQGMDAGVPLPQDEDFGVLCFIELEDVIVANAPVFHVFSSVDGGLSWQETDLARDSISMADCSPNSKLPGVLWATADGQVRYRFSPGVSVEMSQDQGSSWEIVYDLTEIHWEPVSTPEPDKKVVVRPGPLDAMIDPHSGNLLLAMGHSGVLLHQPAGEWRWVMVGEYRHALSADSQTSEATPDVEELTPTGDEIAPDVVIDTQNAYVNAMVYSPDSQTLAVSGFEGGIKLFSVQDNGLLYWHKWDETVSQMKLYGAAFSPDGKTLVTCGTNVDQALRFWDVATWKQIKQYNGYQTGEMDAGSFGDQQYLAVAFGADSSAPDQVKIFSLPEGEEISTLSSDLGAVSALRFIPGSNLLAVGGILGGVEIWEFDTGGRKLSFQPEQTIGREAALYQKVMALGYDPDAEELSSLSGDGLLTSWQIPEGVQVRQLALPVPHGWYIYSSMFSPDGKWMAVGMYNGALLVFDTENGTQLTQQWVADGGSLMKVAISPDGNLLAAGFADGVVRVWQLDRLVLE